MCAGVPHRSRDHQFAPLAEVTIARVVTVLLEVETQLEQKAVACPSTMRRALERGSGLRPQDGRAPDGAGAPSTHPAREELLSVRWQAAAAAVRSRKWREPEARCPGEVRRIAGPY